MNAPTDTPRAPRGRLLLQFAVIVAAGALGVWLAHEPSPAPVKQPTEGTTPEAVDPLERLLVEADEAIVAEDWATCLTHYSAALKLAPAHEEAQIGQAYCAQEQVYGERWIALQNAVHGRRWRHARNLIAAIPAESVYFARAQAMETRIREGIRAQAAEQRELALNPPPPPLTHKPPKVSTRMLRRDVQPPEDPPEEPSEDVPVEGPADLEDVLPVDPEERERTLAYRELIGQAMDASAELDRPRAIELLEDAIDFAPEKHRAYMQLCAIHRSGGETAQALDRCHGWMEREPKAAFRRAIRMMIDRIEREEAGE